MEEIQVYCHAINQPDFDPVIDWLRSHSSQVQPERLALIHGDYHPWNISLRDEDRALVLGWDGARISDYRVDLAWTLILADTYATPQVRDFMLNEYERLANHQVEQMDYFNVAASLKRLFVMIASTTSWSNTAEMQSRAEELAEQDGDHIRAVYTLLQEKTGLTVPVIDRLLQDLN
jgi:aminoglycoside phosphotransferase (APT) family kinase protein